MNRPRWHALLLLGTVVAVALLASGVSPPLRAHAAAQPGSPGPPNWQILVNNISPAGHNWRFNAFYPDHLQAHPGDTIVFTLAPNPNAFHTVAVAFQGLTPLEDWAGFGGGFAQPNPLRRDELQSTFLQDEIHVQGPSGPLCGRAGAAPCLIDGHDPTQDAVNSGALMNPPPQGGQGNTSFTITLAPSAPLGPFYVVSRVDGPSMIARIDV